MTKAPNGSSDDPHSAADPEATVQHWASVEHENEADRQAVRAVLASRIPMNFQDNALDHVLEFISHCAGLDIQVDWGALGSIGVDPEAPVSLSMPRALLLSTVLDRVLADVSDPDVPAGWTVKDGSVVVTSDDEVRLRYTKVRAYAIGDLLRDMEASSGEPKAKEQIANELVASITELIDEPGWRINGGDTGTIVRFGTFLGIRTTESNHKQVEGLLEAARKCQTQKVHGEGNPRQPIPPGESTEGDDQAEHRGQGGDELAIAGSVCKLPTLQAHDNTAAQLRLTGKTQSQIADQLNDRFGTHYTQPRVSEMLKRWDSHAEATGLAENILSAGYGPTAKRPTVVSVDPAALEQGARQDSMGHEIRAKQQQNARDSD